MGKMKIQIFSSLRWRTKFIIFKKLLSSTFKAERDKLDIFFCLLVDFLMPQQPGLCQAKARSSTEFSLSGDWAQALQLPPAPSWDVAVVWLGFQPTLRQDAGIPSSSLTWHNACPSQFLSEKITFWKKGLNITRYFFLLFR